MTDTAAGPRNEARGLDHLVIGIRDLDAAAEFYQRVGFVVGKRNRHPWGTHNRIVQFPGFFLELITVGELDLIPEHAPDRFSFGAFVRDALARGEGASMLALESRDAAGDNAWFHASGIGGFEPFLFERQGTGPDGEAVRVAFSLAFTRNPAIKDCSFFVCQQHEPQNFWNPVMQQHACGATAVMSVLLLTQTPSTAADFLRNLTGAEPAGLPNSMHLVLPRGQIEVMTPDEAAKRYSIQGIPGGLAGFVVGVDDLAAVASLCESGGIGYVRTASHLTILPQDAFGTAIVFVPH